MKLATQWNFKADESPAEPEPKPTHAPVATPSDAADRCRAYLERMPDAVSGEGGHNVTFQAACETVRFGLSDGEAASVMQWFNSAKCRPAWGEAEIQHKLDSARSKVTAEGEVGRRLTEQQAEDTEPQTAWQIAAGGTGTPAGGTKQPTNRETLTNVRTERTKNADGETETKTHAIPPSGVRQAVIDNCGPVYTLGDGGPLFVPTDSETPPIRILKDPPDLFAWLKQSAEVYWAGKADKSGEVVTKTELLSTLRANPVASYDAVATAPHHPPMARTYYAHSELPPATGEHLAEFIDHLNPETDADRDLLKAMILSPAWGGPAGARPMLVLSSDYGRGTGKTKTAEAVGHLYGGGLTVSLETRDGIDRLRQRLLAPSNAALRLVNIDNVKSAASSGEIESLITANTIDGHRLHHGDARRANNLVWTLTANGVGLSRDLADRSVLIKLGKQKRGDFASWAWRFIDNHRPQLMADILAELRSEPKAEIDPGHRDRWAAWQDAVLSRLPNANELARLIIERRGGLDVDASDWDEVQSIVEGLVEAVGYSCSQQPVFVPSKSICDRFGNMTGQRLTGKGLITMLARFAGIDGAERLQRNPCNKHGRGYLWMPERGTLANSAVLYPDWEGIDAATLKRIHY